MLLVGFKRLNQALRHHAAAQGLDDLLHLAIAEQNRLVLLDEADVSVSHNIRRQSGLQFAVTPKHDYRDQLFWIYPEELLQNFDMPIVLVQRILKAEFLAEEVLRPLGAFLIAKDPAVHIFRLDDKDAMPRHDDVVDLRCPIGGLQGDIMKRPIDLLVE